MPDSIRYDKGFTKALGLDNQTLKLDAAKDTEAHKYEEPVEGMEIIELLDDTPKNERRVLGHCTFKIYQQPIPFFYVSWVVRKNKPKEGTEESGKSVGDMVMERVNAYIKEKKLPGILGNAIPNNTTANDVYERNGWKKLPFDDPNTPWMGYNLPQDLTPEQIVEIVKETKADDPYFASHGG